MLLLVLGRHSADAQRPLAWFIPSDPTSQWHPLGVLEQALGTTEPIPGMGGTTTPNIPQLEPGCLAAWLLGVVVQLLLATHPKYLYPPSLKRTQSSSRQAPDILRFQGGKEGRQTPKGAPSLNSFQKVPPLFRALTATQFFFSVALQG